MHSIHMDSRPYCLLQLQSWQGVYTILEASYTTTVYTYKACESTLVFPHIVILHTIPRNQLYTYLGFQTLLQTSLTLPSSVTELMKSVHNSRKSPLTLTCIRLVKAPLHIMILHTILRKKQLYTCLGWEQAFMPAFTCIVIHMQRKI